MEYQNAVPVGFWGSVGRRRDMLSEKRKMRSVYVIV
jgi:hypothetical protein